MHFDGGMSWLMEHNKDRYSAYADYNDNIRKSYYDEMDNVDSLGVPSIIRQIMYDPMTFILIPNDEEKPSVLANHWRIIPASSRVTPLSIPSSTFTSA